MKTREIKQTQTYEEDYRDEQYIYLDFQEQKSYNKRKMLIPRKLFEQIEISHILQHNVGDLYSQEQLEESRDNDEISVAEESFMQGYLA